MAKRTRMGIKGPTLEMHPSGSTKEGAIVDRETKLWLWNKLGHCLSHFGGGLKTYGNQRPNPGGASYRYHEKSG